jgi:2-oxoglutarate dehydrogenase E2 component (dihydrolipoamide succinyltransferase)
MVPTFQECDLGNLIALREELGESFEKAHGVKLGIISSFLKASAQTLLRIPAANSCTRCALLATWWCAAANLFMLNAVVDMDGKEIVYNDFVDINVAVASEPG